MTIYYGEDGNGYLLPSSQGDSTFTIYDRAGSNFYLGKFAIDNVEESDGADISTDDRFADESGLINDICAKIESDYCLLLS